MKKWLLSSLVGLFLVSVVSVSHAAVSADVLVKVNGDAKFATLYFPLGKNGMTLDLGLGLFYNQANATKLGYSAVVGVGNWSILGGIDTDLVITNAATGTASSAVYITPVVSKTWLYRVTDQFNIGFTAELYSFDSRTGTHSILGAFYPVFGAKLDLF